MEFNIKNIYLISLLLFFILLIGGGMSIKCWSCRSDADPKCSDPFDNTSFAIKDCVDEPPLETYPGVKSTMCRKIRQKVDGVWKYIRNCAYLGEPGIKGDERFCLMRTGTYNIFLEYCTCNSKDGCNVSSHLAVSKTLFVGSVLSLVLIGIFR